MSLRLYAVMSGVSSLFPWKSLRSRFQSMLFVDLILITQWSISQPNYPTPSNRVVYMTFDSSNKNIHLFPYSVANINVCDSSLFLTVFARRCNSVTFHEVFHVSFCWLVFTLICFNYQLVKKLSTTIKFKYSSIRL